MKRTTLALAAALLIGAAVGSAITWLVMPRFSPAKENENISYLTGNPEDWLLPPKMSTGEIFSQPGAMDILDSPDSITLHKRVSGPGETAITYDEFSFAAKGTEVSAPHKEPLLYSVRSISTYGMSTMCLFDPVVLMRCTRQGQSIDLLFCFSCNDLKAYTHDSAARGRYMGAGITPQGRKALITYLSRAMPSHEALRKAYEKYPRLQGD